MPKAKYNEGLRAASFTQSQVPPFIFDNVSMRVFPLRATVANLSNFCDAYLNIAPKEIVYFRPSMPFVFLMILNYGRMSPAASNLGWVGQSEIVFSVPLEWYRMEGGRLVFQDWAYVSPFIFVNESISMTTGREVYGWAKHLAHYEASVSPWTRDPRSNQLMMRLGAIAFPHLYGGARPEPCVLLEIEREHEPSITEVPVDPTGPLNPLHVLSNSLFRIASQSETLLEVLNGIRIFPPQALNLQGLTGRLDRATSMSTADAAWNTITLKQFRDEVDPEQACYQALLSSSMKIRRINRWGLSNDPALLLGDLSGGFRIRINHYPSFPVIDTLGLKVSRWDEGRLKAATGETVAAGPAGNTDLSEVWSRRGFTERGRTALLEPVLPFWLDVHMNYGLGKKICWREKGGRWRTDRERISVAAGAPGQRNAAGDRGESHAKKPRTPYNTSLSGALLEALPPFLFPEVTLRVLPLAADPEKLQEFVGGYLNGSDMAYFQAYGSYVYLLVWTMGQAISRDNNVGNFKYRIVSFAVPVKRYDKRGGELVSLGIVSPFVFADSDMAVATWREVLGIPCVKATMERPPDTWMWESESPPDRNLLRLSTDAYPALNVGQSAEERTLLEICEGDVLPTRAGQFEQDWRFVSEFWGGWMKEELERKIKTKRDHPELFPLAQDLAMEVFAAGKPFNILGLKQFRDSEEPGKACYQAIVQNRFLINRIYNIQEIEKPLVVRLHRYASVPIRELLGIKLKLREVSKSPMPGRVWRGAEVEIAQPVRPFWMKFAARSRKAEKLCHRVEDHGWHRGETEPGYFQTDPKVGKGLLEFMLGQGEYAGAAPGGSGQDFIDLKAGFKEWKNTMGLAGQELYESGLFSPQGARTIVENVEPQPVIESLLNRKLGRWPAPEDRAWEHPWEFFIPVRSVSESFRDQTFPAFHHDSEEGVRFVGRNEDGELYIGSQFSDLLQEGDDGELYVGSPALGRVAGERRRGPTERRRAGRRAEAGGERASAAGAEEKPARKQAAKPIPKKRPVKKVPKKRAAMKIPKSRAVKKPRTKAARRGSGPAEKKQ